MELTALLVLLLGAGALTMLPGYCPARSAVGPLYMMLVKLNAALVPLQAQGASATNSRYREVVTTSSLLWVHELESWGAAFTFCGEWGSRW